MIGVVDIPVTARCRGAGGKALGFGKFAGRSF